MASPNDIFSYTSVGSQDKDMWMHDQTRGYKNASASHESGLGEFIIHILNKCNEALDKKRQTSYADKIATKEK